MTRAAPASEAVIRDSAEAVDLLTAMSEELREHADTLRANLEELTHMLEGATDDAAD